MADAYDVIVVGAGPGGITCAALLAKWGVRVLVVDKNSQVGGKAMTISKDGFRYEFYPIFPCPGTGSQIEMALGALGLEDKVELHRPHPFAKLLYEDPSGEIRTMLGSGAGHVPDPQGFFDLLGIAERDSDEALRVFSEITLMGPQERDELDDVTILEYLDRCRAPRPVYSFIATLQSEATLEVPDDVSCASEVVKVFQQLITGGGGCYPAGGLGALYEAIAQAAQASGCNLVLKSRVGEVRVRDGRVTGVDTEKGSFQAPIVVSNAGIQPTVLKLVGEKHFDRGYVNYVKDLVPSLGFAGARYILNKPVLDNPLMACFSDDLCTSDTYVKAEKGEMPEKPYVFVSTNSLFPGMAPPGKQLVHTGMTCPADPQTDPKPWLDKVEAEVGRIWPEILEHVEQREYYGPAHISGLSRDSVIPGAGGECIGLGQIVGQCGRHKPSAKAPIRGLFYVGADAGSTGFFANNLAVGSGINVARMVLQYMKTHRQ